MARLRWIELKTNPETLSTDELEMVLDNNWKFIEKNIMSTGRREELEHSLLSYVVTLGGRDFNNKSSGAPKLKIVGGL